MWKRRRQKPLKKNARRSRKRKRINKKMCIVSGKVFLKMKGMGIGEIRRDWVQTLILN
jgi:hypothetical protein